MLGRRHSQVSVDRHETEYQQRLLYSRLYSLPGIIDVHAFRIQARTTLSSPELAQPPCRIFFVSCLCLAVFLSVYFSFAFILNFAR